MRRRKISPPIVALGIILGLIFIGAVGERVLDRILQAIVEPGARSTLRPSVSSEGERSTLRPSVSSDGERATDRRPVADLAVIQSERKIVNVHEHVQGMDEAELLLKAMDTYGVERTVLMGSSWFTITLNESVGFTRYDENNDGLVEIAKAFPGRFDAWPTIDPQDSEKLEKLQSLHERGASGLKLYLGHGFVRRSDNEYMFHTMAMDDPRMFPIYDYCQENFLPLCFHVNPGPTKDGFAQEFIAVLKAFPDLKVIAPHFILSSIKDSRLREFLDSFPNVYTDMSFGHDSFLGPGLERISRNPKKYRELLNDYPDRFMWGTDLVITNYVGKTEEWMGERFQAYLDMMTKETYTTPIVPGKTLKGLAIGGELLERVLYTNYNEFVAKRPRGTKITRDIRWRQMGVKQVPRESGQAFAPKPK